MHHEIVVATHGQGLTEITGQVAQATESSRVRRGLVNVFIRHTSASLTIQENADPAVLADLHDFFGRLVPEGNHYAHDDEGPDDMPAHIKAALTQTHLAVPLIDGRLALGTWQGIYVWEHRHAPHTRRVVVSVVPG